MYLWNQATLRGKDNVQLLVHALIRKKDASSFLVPPTHGLYADKRASSEDPTAARCKSLALEPYEETEATAAILSLLQLLFWYLN